MIPVQTPLPKIPLGTAVEVLIEWIQVHLHGFLTAISRAGTLVNDNLVDLLLAVPPLLMVVVFVLVAWMAKSWRLAVGTAVTFLIIISLGQWVNAMETLVLVTLATLTALVFAVPLGIWAARNKYVSVLIRPVLDLMQTMPAGVRMTELGIKQVDKETVEAGRSFGATDWQILRGIQLPLAVPTIMAGVNQVIMLALSMAVIAGMVGADGLGKEVVKALATIDIAKGTEAGLSIVFLAIYLDRVTAALGAPREKGSLLSLIKKR